MASGSLERTAASRRALPVLLVLGTLAGVLLAVPSGAVALSNPTASSEIAFRSLPTSVAPGQLVIWAVAAVCAGTSPSVGSCADASSPVGGVPDGYSVRVLIQQGTVCDFTTESTADSRTTKLGLSEGAFFAPMSPGTYCLVVQHPSQVGLGSGRQKVVDWLPAASGTELVTVVARTSVTTVLSATSIAIGGSATDTATLSGGANPTGTITFAVHSLPDCSDQGSTVGVVQVEGNGVYVSPPLTPSSPGTYYWQASYSGDSANFDYTEACGVPHSEVLAVNLASPTVTTSLSDSGSIAIGGSATDSATLVGAYDPTGTITFTAYSDPSCSSLVFTSTNEVSGLTVTSSPFTPAIPGTYYWEAAYSGDGNNQGSVTPCGTEGEALSVNYLSCPQVPDRGGANLKGADLEFCELEGYDLSGDILSGTNLQYADLRGANLAGANLMGSNLGGADAAGAVFSSANLKGAYLPGADIAGDDLSGANLMGASLSGANASGAIFQGDNLRGADLSNGQFTGASFQDANLVDCNMSYGEFGGANFTGANADGANTTGAYFTGAVDAP